ncbi:putative urotensin-2 receptor-like [Penaeus vannamei]|uniref:Putative urotensin-2 receptor-like n=1 Tax=Penaeus vannamei TaxID=6689 RepID=A0A423SZ91_PENVA|nr:putative urotensin-2 receptor-like [Penaeus vannamei]
MRGVSEDRVALYRREGRGWVVKSRAGEWVGGPCAAPRGLTQSPAVRGGTSPPFRASKTRVTPREPRRADMADLDESLAEEELELAHKVELPPIAATLKVELGLMILSAIAGVCANLAAIWVAASARKSNVINLYVLQRAVSDLLYLLTVPVLAARILMRTWAFGSAICKLTVSSAHMCIFASSAFLVAMSVECYRHYAHNAPMARTRCFYAATTLIWIGVVSLSASLISYIDVVKGYSGMFFCTVTDFNLKFLTFIDSLSIVMVMVPMLINWGCILRMAAARRAWKRMGLSEKALANRRFLVALSAAYTVLLTPFCITRLLGMTSSFSLTLLRALQLTSPLTYINATVSPLIVVRNPHLSSSRLHKTPPTTLVVDASDRSKIVRRAVLWRRGVPCRSRVPAHSPSGLASHRAPLTTSPSSSGVTTRGGMDELDDLALDEESELHSDGFSEINPFMTAAAGVMVVSAAVGICANLYVVCAASTSLRSNVVNVYVLQRTLAHLVSLLFTPTLAAHIFLHGWTFGDALCRMTVGFVHIAGYADLLFLISMCVDGHKAFDTYSLDTRLRDAKIAAAAVWLLAATLGAPLFAVFGTIQGPDGMAYCTLIYNSWAAVVILNYVNLLLMLVALVVPGALVPGMFPPRDGRRREVSDEALAARRLILTLVASFWIFHLPYAITYLCSTVAYYFNPVLIKALHLTAVLPYVSAAVDPVIYIVLRRSLASPRAAAHTRGVEITYVNLMPEL